MSIKTVPELAADLQGLYSMELPALVAQGKHLIESLPQKSPTIAQLIFSGSIGRIWVLLQDVCTSFNDRLGDGYFTTAAISRSMMETATLILYLNKDKSGEALSAYLAEQQQGARKRRDGLAKMCTSQDKLVADNARQELVTAEMVLECIKSIRSKANLPSPSINLPTIEQRCRKLGPSWEFQYHALYRDLCEAVHGAFFKVPFTPSLAFNSGNKGEALVFEHCRAFNYAIDFWAVVILDCCQNQPDQESYLIFRDNYVRLNKQEGKISDEMHSVCQKHQITF